MTTTPRRLLIVADVGGEETRHIGDEAMLEANLAGFRAHAPDVRFTVVSRDPAWTTARYGVEAVAPFGFRRQSDFAERQAMLERILAAAADRAHATVGAVAAADGVVLSGGGNLSATWPDLLYERATLLHLARIFDKPSVVLGQTIGPHLGGDERRLLEETLPTARFVGVRELPSAALAMELGVAAERLWYQCDDALTLDASVARAAGAKIAVTIDPQLRVAGDSVFGAFVEQLRELVQQTGAQLVLVPHAFGDESYPSDLTEARVLSERIAIPSTTIVADAGVQQAKQVAAEAALVISTRYHPLVFALGAAVPCIGIYGDDYCRIKLQGALMHANRDRWALTYEDVSRGQLLATGLELWNNRDEMRRELEARRDGWAAESRERWAAVMRALDPASVIPPADPLKMFGRPLPEVAPPLAAALEARRRAAEWQQAKFDEAKRKLQRELSLPRTLRRYASALLRRLRGH